MAVLWRGRGVCAVCTKQRRFANKIFVDPMRVNSPRLVTKRTCRNNALSFVIWEEPLSMMIDRAGGWMEWTGAVKGRTGAGGVGIGTGEGRGGGRGVPTVRF